MIATAIQVGHYYEGTRLCQYPNIIGYFINLASFVFSKILQYITGLKDRIFYPYLGPLINFVMLALSLYLFRKYGEGSINDCSQEMFGKYKVGIK